MATYEGIKVLNLPAGANLNNALYDCVAIGRATGAVGLVVKADANAADVNAHFPIGILASNPGVTADGDMVPVIPIAGGGIAKVKASGAITRGQILVPSNTAGKVTGVDSVASLAADQRGLGIALQAASAEDEIIEVFLDPVAAPHSA